MIRHRWYIGTEGVPDNTWGAIEERLIATFAGYTMYLAIGAWRNPATTVIITEHTRVYEVLEVHSAHIEATMNSWGPILAPVFAEMAGQTSVLWTSERIDGGFSA